MWKLRQFVTLFSIGLACFSSLPFSASAGELDAASQEALQKTRQLLVDPDQRSAAIARDPSSQMIDEQVKALAGNPGNANEIYGLSGDIFSDLVNQAGGDVGKLQEMLVKAKNDPKAFHDSLSAKNREALRRMADKIKSDPTVAQPAGPSTH